MHIIYKKLAIFFKEIYTIAMWNTFNNDIVGYKLSYRMHIYIKLNQTIKDMDSLFEKHDW